MKPTIILYLIGKAGTGKYTIAQEIAKAGYRICDNQLVNNPIFTLLDLDGRTPIPERAWDAIEEIRHSVFTFIAAEPAHNYVLTNELYDVADDHQIFAQVEALAAARESMFVPVLLVIESEELRKRIQTPARRLRFKTTDVKHVDQERTLIPVMHPNALQLKVTDLSAAEAAANILQHVNQLARQKSP